MIRLMREVVGDKDLARKAEEWFGSGVVAEDRLRQASSELWSQLRRVAAAAPEDPAVICELVSQDRRLHNRAIKGEMIMAEADVKEKPAKAVKEKAAPAAPKEKKIAGYPATAKIEFGVDKEDKPFGPKNNPKREGSKSHASFALYKSGMTLQKAVDAGVSTGDIAWDLSHNFIKIAA